MSKPLLRQRSRDLSSLPERKRKHTIKNSQAAPPLKAQEQSRGWTVFTIVFSALAITLVLLSRFNQFPSTSISAPANQEYDDQEYNGFELHPERHLTRSPTTVKYQWNVTADTRRPDGVLKRVYLVNDAFPGPTLEVRSGDRVVIEVVNQLTAEGISIHWHGLAMENANRMDGAVGITQEPIHPGESFLYDFTIGSDESGTFWYHAHDGVQRADGLYGGLIVHNPDVKQQGPWTDSEKLLLIGDWYHRSGEEAHTFFSHPGAFGNEPVPDSILLQGTGIFNCSDAVPARPVDCLLQQADALPALHIDRSKRIKLRVVNVGSYAGIELDIDNAHLRPLFVDGGSPVEAASSQKVGFLYPGERVDLLLEPQNTTRTDLLTITLEEEWFKYNNPSLTSTHYFPISYTNISPPPLSHQPAIPHLDLTTLASPSSSHAPFPSVTNQTLLLYTMTQKLTRLDNRPLGFINHTTWSAQSPPLISLPRSSWNDNQLVPRIPSNTWTDIILNNLDEEPHPFHLHGLAFYVLGTYTSDYNWGSWNPFEDAEPPGGELNTGRAVRKDTVVVPRRGYAVLRVWSGEGQGMKGLWMLHCHVLWHQAAGMGMAVEVF